MMIEWQKHRGALGAFFMTSKSKFLEHLLATAQSRLNIGFSGLIDIDAYVELTLNTA